MGAMNRQYTRIDCSDCGKSIGRNNIMVHLRACKPYQARLKRERAEWVKTAPIDAIGLGEAQAAGRYGEFVAYLEYLASQQN